MTWLLVLAGALACWLAYTLCRARAEIKRGREGPGGCVYLVMGGQAEVAEWFLRSVCLCDGILSGRLDVSVEAEGSGDDTAGIVEILSRGGGYSLAGPGVPPGSGDGCGERLWRFDVRGMNTTSQLEVPLKVLMAL